MAPKCAFCPSRVWRKDDTGALVCQFGHQRQDYVEEVADQNSYIGAPAEYIRKRKKGKKAKSVVVVKELSFGVQCELFQEVLKRQINVLISKKAFPVQFREAVLEVWLIYISSAEKFKSLGEAFKLVRNTGNTLIFSYLGARVVQLPPCLNQLHKWASDYEIPTWLKQDELPPYFTSQIAPTSLMRICKAPPTLWDLAANITIVKDFLVDFVGYKLPNINWPQFLFQTLESLHLMSPELFAMCDVMRDVMFAFYSDSITESDVGMAVAMAMGVKLMYGLGYNNVASDEAKETDKEFLDVPCISESLAHLASSMKPRTMSKNDFEALKNYLKLAIANSALAGKEHRHRVEIFQHFIGNQESTAESAQLIESNASTPDDQSTPSFSRVHPGLTSAYWVSYNPNDVPSGYHPLYAYFLHHLACQLLMDVFKLQKEVSKCERSLAALWPDGTNVQLPAQPKVLKDRLNRETGWREYAVLLVGAEKSVWISSLDMVRDHTAALDEYQYQKARKQVSTYKAARPWRPKRARVEPEQREEGEEEAEGNGRGTSAEDMDIDDRESTSDD